MTAKLKDDARDVAEMKKVVDDFAKKRYRSSKKSKDEEQALDELAFKEKRLKENRREAESFFFSFSGARIFFKEDKEEKEAGETPAPSKEDA